MSDSFVPLFAKLPPGASFPGSAKITVVSDPNHGFAPLQFPAHAAAPDCSASDCPSRAPAQPAVHYKKEGDRIVGFKIECPCGQVFEFACVY